MATAHNTFTSAAAATPHVNTMINATSAATHVRRLVFMPVVVVRVLASIPAGFGSYGFLITR